MRFLKFLKIILWSLLVVVLCGELLLFGGGFYLSRGVADQETNKPVDGFQRMKEAFVFQAAAHFVLFDYFRPRVAMDSRDLIQNLSQGSGHYFRSLDRYGRYASFFKVRLTGTLVRSYFDDQNLNYWFLVIGPVVREGDKAFFVLVQKPFGAIHEEPLREEHQKFIRSVNSLNGSLITVDGLLDRNWTSGGQHLVGGSPDTTEVYTVVDATQITGKRIP